LAATQFEATYARMVMPCYDEPAFKAIFKIKITHDISLNALSNMPQTSRTISGGQATTTFQDTPTMSTFIVAFIVSDYKFVESLDSKFRVFVPVRYMEHDASFGFCEWKLGLFFTATVNLSLNIFN
jgi:aminopeptidase N